ncbi:MAG: hypothetical protein ACYYK0_06870, partial [Candidatus Eutrophobiaceae bacterium]
WTASSRRWGIPGSERRNVFFILCEFLHSSLLWRSQHTASPKDTCPCQIEWKAMCRFFVGAREMINGALFSLREMPDGYSLLGLSAKSLEAQWLLRLALVFILAHVLCCGF